MDLKTLPKIELHRHLEGAIRYRTLRDIHGRVPPTAHHFTRGEPRGWTRLFEKFLIYRRVRFNERSVRRVAREAVQDAAAERVFYFEMRFNPVAFTRGNPQLDPRDVAGWVVDAAQSEARRRGMEIRFLATLNRQFGPDVNAHAVDAAIALRPWFVGIDVAGNERTHPDLAPLGKLLRKAGRAGLPLSIHAGEGGPPANVRDAILKWGAARIGHGVRSVEDGRVVELALRRGIVFEMCPTSNIDTKVWTDTRRHPIKRLLRAGLKVTLNSDDPAISGIDLVHECRLARKVIGLTDAEIVRLQLNAVEAAFAGDAVRRSLRRTFERTKKNSR